MFVCDVTEEPLSSTISESSIDLALMIFVLSAISPEKMVPALTNVLKVLHNARYDL